MPGGNAAFMLYSACTEKRATPHSLGTAIALSTVARGGMKAPSVPSSPSGQGAKPLEQHPEAFHLVQPHPSAVPQHRDVGVSQ